MLQVKDSAANTGMVKTNPSKSRKKRGGLRIIMILCVLAVLAAGGFYFHESTSSSAKAETPTVITIENGNIEDVVTAQGKLEPKDYVDVGVQVSGQLKKLHVDIGDMVKAGDLLAEIDPKVYEARVEADQANLKRLKAQMAEQQAQVRQSQLKFQRNKKLIELKAVSQEIYEAADAEFQVAKAQQSALQAQIEEAQSTLDGDMANLGYTKIFAPMSGTVVAQTTKEGQTVNASQSAPTIVQLADLDMMTVRAQVAEADIMRIAPGLNVYFTTLGSGERRWKGTVRQVLPTPEIINDVVLYNVLVDVDNKDRQLMTGMSTQMFFVLGKAANVPVIPVTALGKRLSKQDNETGQAYQVRALNGKTPADRTVYIGLMDRTMAEVKSGLIPGDKVLVAKSAGPAKQQAQPGGRMRGGMPRL
jgi:macrolide-specific efflux system membrane fusion protein